MSMPTTVTLLTQRIKVVKRQNLHHMPDGAEEGEHGHRAYGIYEEGPQVITMDSALRFERARETFLHENLHAIFAITQLDALLENEAGHGAAEHFVSAMAPVMLAWLRDNPDAVTWLREVQS